ncbi:glycosyltransferase family 9 protein [Pontibacter qinzhouensis]|uniref:Glycosyltransferase family 9 protein n=1 Tax=Pontibacter qinzhouensis TaxID=2603253 RepID=A0A5C8KEF9_9BACT|nr:glycosyltransferase family 9 protein [Pontibacter qinzhouensis]TXK50804.1 glycosyltransferase family 9 protein [Pontibacter qinzhouensis]
MKTILISRPDAIGDVVLTLPMCGWLKHVLPGCRIIFLGSTYTAPVVACCEHVDSFINADTLLALPYQEQVNFLKAQSVDIILHVLPHKAIARLAYKARIPLRVGTRNRWFHWRTCNKLVALSRKNSDLHESQLNLQLLQGIGINHFPAFAEMHRYTGFTRVAPLPAWAQELLNQKQPGKLNIILHPKSRGSAREWSLQHYGALARLLHGQGHQVFVTGTAKEGDLIRDWLQEHSEFVLDMTGRFELAEFISFTSAADGIVAASTGSLHLVAVAGGNALGIYVPMRPLHPGRWAPIGEHADFLVKPIDCNACRKAPATCSCINEVSPDMALGRILNWRPPAKQDIEKPV